MEKLNRLVRKQYLRQKAICLFVPLFISLGLGAQNKSSVKGYIIDRDSNTPVPFATVRLLKESDTAKQLITGTMSNGDGTFIITPVVNGNYKLQISSIGYKMAKKDIVVNGSESIDAGTIGLHDSTMMLAEAIVAVDRVKGKSESDKTIFYMNKKTLKASGNAPDILRHIPGIQVDLKQNISLEGNRNILLLVNGKERNKSYISQLNPSNVDRVEVFSTPPPKYDGNVSGVINIILKAEKDAGISGHAFSEIPTSKSVVYSFPSLGLNYSFNKINLYTSYNGEINYENIDEITTRAMNNLTIPNNNMDFVTQVNNLGTIQKYGAQISGSATFGILTLNSSVRLYHNSTHGNSLAREYGIKDSKDIVFESDFSSILSFNNDYSFSVIFQYATPKNNIQDKTFSDALYFISLDKTFEKKLKVGIVSALPFVENFVYQGTEINAQNFSSHYTGNLQLPTIPLMFRFSYQFSSGKKVAITERRQEEIDKRPKPGL